MARTGLSCIFAVVFAAAATSVNVSAAQGIPAEMPPSWFTDPQYVDSAGCAFLRVGSGENTQWLPRVGRDRVHVCGLSPTLDGTPQVASAPPSAEPAPGLSQRPMWRPDATTPGTTGTQPLSLEITPLPSPEEPAPEPEVTSACANLPADLQPYFTGRNARCGPQEVHPGEAARGIVTREPVPTASASDDETTPVAH